MNMTLFKIRVDEANGSPRQVQRMTLVGTSWHLVHALLPGVLLIEITTSEPKKESF